MKTCNFHILVLLTFLNLSVSSQTWNRVGNITTAEFPNSIYINALLEHNGYLYVAGMFDSLGKSWCNLMKWDGTHWSIIGKTNGTYWGETIRCLTIYHGSIIAGGYFNSVNGVATTGVARWDGTQWHSMDLGVGGTAPHIEAVIVYNGILYVGGTFTECSGFAAAGIALWNENTQQWNPASKVPPTRERSKVGIYCYSIYNNELYCGGTYDQDTAIFAKNVNNNWHLVSGGIRGGIVKTMTTYDNKLIVGGHFNLAGSVSVTNIATWNGTSWNSLMALNPESWVYGLCSIGNTLYISGNISSPSAFIVSYPSNYFVNHTCNDQIWALANYPIGSNNLVAAGWMTKVDTIDVMHIAMWGNPIITSANSNHQAINFSLGQNYPNPFNPVTKIEYSIPVKTKVKIEVYNIAGQVVDILIDKEQNAGEYNITWNASEFPTGVYFYKLQAGNYNSVKKMLMIK